MNDRFKQIIFDKLYQDLKHVEIIPYDGSVFFISRETKYWYFRYGKSGELWWRWGFFTNFFALFSMEVDDFEPLISEWVEEALNCMVKTTTQSFVNYGLWVEDALNYKVKTTRLHVLHGLDQVEEVLNHKNN